MKGYSEREVAKLLDIPLSKVRAFVRSGFLTPERDEHGAAIFSFQDLVLMRTAKGLVDSRIAPVRVKRVLRKLKDQLPDGRPLTGVSIGAEGNKVVVRDGTVRWNPENGQALFDFDVRELARKVEPLVDRAAKSAHENERTQTAEDWFALGCNLELNAPGEARDAYRRAIELDPEHGDAHLNLGRLLHEEGQLEAAEAHYRLALAADEKSALAAFNLGVVLQDCGRASEAIGAYEQVLALDKNYADAHYNLAQLYERAGQQMKALRHLKAYKQLLDGRGT